MGIPDETRRTFLKQSLYAGAVVLGGARLPESVVAAPGVGASAMKFGLVTYLWGQDWDVPTLITNCTKTGVLGVELRTQHAHGVESNLNAEQRRQVRKRFADSAVTLVGLGTNFAFHYPDPDRLKAEIKGAKEYIELSHDVGGSGVKVKPNDMPKGVEPRKTIEQIGRALNELGRFAVDYGQEVRLEVHGGCSPLPIIRQIMDVADHPRVGVCWNSNGQDLQGLGLEYSFKLVRDRFGGTVHVWDLDSGRYPYQELVNLLLDTGYPGWILLEARGKPEDRVAALAEQRKMWEAMVAEAAGSTAARTQEHQSTGVGLVSTPEKVTVNIGGELFTEYNIGPGRFPYFYPVIGPNGINITRHWPMKEGEGEEKDHPHHQSFWYTHGEVNGLDFWSSRDERRAIKHDKTLELESGGDVGILRTSDNWVKEDGSIVCTDTRVYRFCKQGDERIVDFEVTIHASHGKVTFGDTKEGSMAMRLAPTLRVEGKVAKGTIVNSEGQRNGDTWGKRAAWCDYYGPLGEDVVGVAIFDHPANPRHPTWWHVRTYGLFAANPFGVHDFERKPAGTGDLTIPAGQSLTWKYRFYFHKGDTGQAKVAERYREYVLGA